MEITPDGPVFHERAIPLVESWRDLRKEIYEFLAFDESCLSGQAMLTDSITLALRDDLLLEDHWHFTDEELLRHLLSLDATKEIIQRFLIGDFYAPLFLGWYSCPKASVDLRHPDVRTRLANDLKIRLNKHCSPYVFYDSGTFSKNLDLPLQNSTSDGARSINLSRKSESTIVAIFTRHRVSALERRRFSETIMDELEKYGFSRSCLKLLPEKQETYEIPGQRKIPFRASAN